MANMSKRIFVLLNAAITLEASEIAAGEVVELTELSAQALIKEGKAVKATPDGETADALKQLQEGGQPNQEPVDPDAELEKVRKALDDQYKADELKAAAKEAGVDFAYDVTKTNLIAAIIEQGKAEALLK
jgi:hypothetical protein